MKKFFIILVAAAALLASCGTPKMAMDINYKGSRVLLTSNTKLCRVEDGHLYVALGAKISEKDTVVAVLLTCDADTKEGIFDRNDHILYRLNDGSTVSIANMYDKEYETSTETKVSSTPIHDYGYAYHYTPWGYSYYMSPYSVTTWVPQVYTVKTTNSYGLYPVSKAQLLQMKDKQLVKIRVENSTGDIDLEDGEMLSEVFKNHFQTLVKAAQEKKDTTF